MDTELLSIPRFLTFTHTHWMLILNLEFSILPKVTSACKLEESGINPPAFKLVDDPLKSLRQNRPWVNENSKWLNLIWSSFSVIYQVSHQMQQITTSKQLGKIVYYWINWAITSRKTPTQIFRDLTNPTLFSVRKPISQNLKSHIKSLTSAPSSLHSAKQRGLPLHIYTDCVPQDKPMKNTSSFRW